jgi:hypothetical protein
MKKINTLFVLFLTGFSFTQNPLTLVFEDLPVVGREMINVNQSNLLGINLGNSGENQTYNFSSFSSGTTDTVKFISVAETPHASLFTNSNISSYNTLGMTYTFFNSSSTELSILGMTMVNPFDSELPQMIVVSSNPLTQMNLPLTYESSFIDSGEFQTSAFPFDLVLNEANPLVYVDSIRSKIKIKRNSTIDGWGTLQTPDGEFPVLRQVVEDINIINPELRTVTDIGFGIVFETWVNLADLNLGEEQDFSDTSKTYFYITNSNVTKPLILAEVSMNNFGVITEAKYAKVNTASTEDLISSNELKLYPNPANYEVSIESEHQINSIKIIGLDGKEIYSEVVKSKSHHIDLKNMNAGQYTMFIETEKGNLIKKVTKY